MRPLRPQEGYDPTTLAGGETHYFQLALEANHYVHIHVVQQGINVVMTLFGPDGRQVAEQALPDSTHSEKTLLLVTEAAGSYRLEVRARDSQAAAGLYNISIRRLLPVTEQNQELITAGRDMAEGWRLHEIGTADALRSAIEKFTEAAPLWRAVGNHDEEAETLIYLGECYVLLSEYQKAIAAFEQALLVCRAARNCAHEGWGSTISPQATMRWAKKRKRSITITSRCGPIRQRIISIKRLRSPG